jgi:glycosyltransferase involved in cell wall biosynthesis
MRILLLAPMVPRPDGPGAIPVLLHAELAGLRERHEVTLVTAVGDDPGEEEAIAALRNRDVDLHLADRRRPPPGRRRWRRRRRLAQRWARGGWPWRTVWYAAPGLQPILDRLTADRPFDVLAIEDSAMSVFRLPEEIPTVYTHHEVLRPRRLDWPAGPPWRWPRWAFGEIDWRRWQGFQRSAWTRFDRVQVFSRRDAQTIATLAPEAAPRVRVNPFGIDLPPSPDPAREVPGSLLFVGNFDHPPNRDAAAWLTREIMPRLHSHQPEARLEIVGTAAAPGLLGLAGDRVRVVSDAPSVRPHLERASLVLAPLRTGGGMRMKVLEAMACGKAVVTTPRGAEGFAGFGEEPPLAIAEGAEEFARVTAGLLDDPARRRELAGGARDFAERRHSPRAWAERLTEVYEEARAAHLEGVR